MPDPAAVPEVLPEHITGAIDDYETGLFAWRLMQNRRLYEHWTLAALYRFERVLDYDFTAAVREITQALQDSVRSERSHMRVLPKQNIYDDLLDRALNRIDYEQIAKLILSDALADEKELHARIERDDRAQRALEEYKHTPEYEREERAQRALREQREVRGLR